MNINLIGPTVIDGNGNQNAEYEKSGIASLRGRRFERKELVHDGTYSEEH